MVKTTTRDSYEHVVRHAIDRIVSSLDDTTDLRGLAAEAFLSAFHFHRIFRGMVGETPLELCRRLRMERAAWRLIHTSQPVTRIGFDAGYETHEGFTRAFRATYGTSPSVFRRRQYSRIEIAAPCGLHFAADGGPIDFIPRNTGGAEMDVEITNQPELRIAAVRNVGPYNRIGEAFQRLGAIAGRAGLFADPAAKMVAIDHDDPDTTPPDELRSDAGLGVSASRVIPEGLSEQRIPAGRYASTLHRGSYERLGDAWARFMGEWLPASGHQLAEGVSYEVYLNTPGQIAPEDLKTEFYIPIEG